MTCKSDLLDVLVTEQGGKCAYCNGPICSLYDMDEGGDGFLKAPAGFRIGELDHKLPKSRGGSDQRENLCASCSSCNGQKRDKTAEEYEAWKAKGRGVSA